MPCRAASPGRPAPSPLVRGRLLRSSAQRRAHPPAPLFVCLIPNVHSVLRILPFPRRGNVVAALAVAEQRPRAPSALGSLRVAKPPVRCHCAVLSVASVGTVTSMKSTVSLHARFSGHRSKHQRFYLHILAMAFTSGAFSHFKNGMR